MYSGELAHFEPPPLDLHCFANLKLGMGMCMNLNGSSLLEVFYNHLPIILI